MRRRRKHEPAETPAEDCTEMGQLIQQIKTQNDLLRAQIRYLSNWRVRLVHGLLFGLGSFVGATILVSLAAYALKPLLSVDILRPAVEQMIHDIEGPAVRTPGRPLGGVAPQYQPDATPELTEPEPPERG